jgi:hypothetical protein
VQVVNRQTVIDVMSSVRQERTRRQNYAVSVRAATFAGEMTTQCQRREDLVKAAKEAIAQREREKEERLQQVSSANEVICQSEHPHINKEE